MLACSPGHRGWWSSAARSLWGLAVGEEDPEGGAPAGAVLDPSAAAMQAGELGDQGQADAGAGAWSAMLRPWRKG
jgi:hypothetical protein